MAITVEVWGEYACFSRPEMKVERVSYDVMTPSAARGLLEAIYWHPGLKWVIDKIRVCAPIRFTSVRRNEIGKKASAQNAKEAMETSKPISIVASDNIAQRAALVLRDVRYVIEAHFDMTPMAGEGDNPGKFQDIMRRRLAKGQCYHQPCFGTREFPANFRACNQETVSSCPELAGERDLGWMLYDMDYSNPADIKPRFFRARLVDGVMVVPPQDSEEVVE